MHVVLDGCAECFGESFAGCCPGHEFHFHGQVEGGAFELVGEVGVAAEAHGVFFGGDDDFVFATHLGVSPAQELEVFAGVVVMVGEDVDFHPEAEAFEVAHEGARVAYSGYGEDGVVFSEPVEIGYAADGVGEEWPQRLVGVA